MPIDEALLAAHRRIERPSIGISEAFLTPTIGGLPTVAILYLPLQTPRSEGWVITHAFGQEQSHLMEHEITAARALAVAGYPVLRYHSQGYGDSMGDPHDVTLSTHLRDAEDAIGVLRAETGVHRIGILGARFGGLVAAIAADRAGLPLLALWEPVTQGSAYMRELLRTQAAADLMRDDEPPEPPAADGDGGATASTVSRSPSSATHTSSSSRSEPT